MKVILFVLFVSVFAKDTIKSRIDQTPNILPFVKWPTHGFNVTYGHNTTYLDLKFEQIVD